MRVCISYTHPYPIKSLNHTLPSRICKLCFWANMQVASTLWPNRKTQKISEYRFRIKWTKCSPRIEARSLKKSSTSVFRPGQAQTSPTPSSWGQLAPLAGRPTPWLADQPVGPTTLSLLRGSMALVPYVGLWRISCRNPMAPCYKYKGGREWEHTHTPHFTHLSSSFLHSL